MPFRPDCTAGRAPSRGTPAVEAALQQAARLAGPLPVGSHHLLLAALDDPNSAASRALACLGVDLDELRAKLRAARLAGTTDEQPEEAGRRQMAIQVSDEMLTIVLTDPVIVAAGKEALRGRERRAPRREGRGRGPLGADGAGRTHGDAPRASRRRASVIRGDHPAAASLADVWRSCATRWPRSPTGRSSAAARFPAPLARHWDMPGRRSVFRVNRFGRR